MKILYKKAIKPYENTTNQWLQWRTLPENSTGSKLAHRKYSYGYRHACWSSGWNWLIPVTAIRHSMKAFIGGSLTRLNGWKLWSTMQWLKHLRLLKLSYRRNTMSLVKWSWRNNQWKSEMKLFSNRALKRKHAGEEETVLRKKYGENCIAHRDEEISEESTDEEEMKEGRLCSLLWRLEEKYCDREISEICLQRRVCGKYDVTRAVFREEEVSTWYAEATMEREWNSVFCEEALWWSLLSVTQACQMPVLTYGWEKREKKSRPENICENGWENGYYRNTREIQSWLKKAISFNMYQYEEENRPACVADYNEETVCANVTMRAEKKMKCYSINVKREMSESQLSLLILTISISWREVWRSYSLIEAKSLLISEEKSDWYAVAKWRIPVCQSCLKKCLFTEVSSAILWCYLWRRSGEEQKAILKESRKSSREENVQRRRGEGCEEEGEGERSIAICSKRKKKKARLQKSEGLVAG